jgi:hypothetical protein
MEALARAQVLLQRFVQPLVPVATLILVAMAALSLSVRLGLLWRRWHLVRVESEPWFYSIDPLLRLTSWWHRKRFGLADVVATSKTFTMFEVRSGKDVVMYEYRDAAAADGSGLSAGVGPPLLVWKLPARHHLGIADFVHLRLLRRLVALGASVAVVIVDATRTRSERTVDMKSATARTRHFVRRMLGAGRRVEIVSLSEGLAEDPQASIAFLLNTYIPLWTEKAGALAKVSKLNASRGSFFAKPLVVYVLSRSMHARPLIMLQWSGVTTERLDAWRQILPLFREWQIQLNTRGYLVAKTFPNENGEMLGSRDPAVAIAPLGEWLGGIVSTPSVQVVDAYVGSLARNMLGVDVVLPVREEGVERLRERLLVEAGRMSHQLLSGSEGSR